MHGRAIIVATLLGSGLILCSCATAPSDGPTSSQSDVVSSRPLAPSATSPRPPADENITSTEPASPLEGVYLDYSDGIIEQTAGPKVLFFHASWCPQCRTLDEELRSEGAPDGLAVFKVDFDSRSDLRQKYGVTLQTTVVFVDDSGEKVSSTVLYEDPSIASLVAAMP